MDLHETVNSHPDSAATSFDEVIDQFDRAHTQGENPRIENYLRGVEFGELSRVLCQLIEIEVEYRIDAMQTVDPREYYRRFPDHADAIAAAFSHLEDGREGLEPRFRVRPGVKIDGLTLGAELGRGGVAVVYSAHDETLVRSLAIKTLLPEDQDGSTSAKPEQSPNLDAVRRLKLEAELTAGLSHLGIPPVHAVGELPDGRPYFCMRLIEGTTFAEILKKGDDDRAAHLQTFTQVAQILASAHQENIIHRDMKPSNVMVGRYGEVQLMDWGMAKRISPAGDRPVSTSDEDCSKLSPISVTPPDAFDNSTLLLPTDFSIGTSVDIQGDATSQGTVLGTFAYMPPEQARGQTDQHDTRTDVFSLGAMLCMILTGRPLYRGGTPDELFRQARDAQLDGALRDLENANVAPELFELTVRCLSVDPAHRPADASEVAEVLVRYSQSAELRLQQAEIERAKAEARTAAETKRAELEVSKRRFAFALASTIGALVILAVASVIVLSIQESRNDAVVAQERRTNDRTRAQALVESVLTAPPAGVPYTLANVLPLKDLARADLEKALRDQRGNSRQRLHAALGLAAMGDVKINYLVSTIQTAPAAECGNILQALMFVKQDALAAVRTQIDAAANSDSSDLQTIARLAIVALYLGDESFFVEMARREEDQKRRTELIDCLATWHGDISTLVEAASAKPDASAQSALLLGISEIASENISPSDVGACKTPLAQLFCESPDSCTHSAAGRILQRWNMALPVLSTNQTPTSDQQWCVTENGVTLIKVPAGHFTRYSLDREPIPTKVVVTGAFLMSDRETSAALFQRFIDDPAYAEARNTDPVRTDRVDNIEFAPGMPISNIEWSDACLFCNWLSEQEGLSPAYAKVDSNWTRTSGAGGYRLPSEAEWELAARAGTTTDFAHSNDTKHLAQYANFGNVGAIPSGSKLPNGYGLFDTQGNLNEWCFDGVVRGQKAAPVLTDPEGTAQSTTKAIRGGSFSNPAGSIRNTIRSSIHLSWIGEQTGFRVARDVEDSAN